MLFGCLRRNSLWVGGRGRYFLAYLTNPTSHLRFSNFSSSLNIIFLRQSAVFLSSAVVSVLAVCVCGVWREAKTLRDTSSRFMLGIQQCLFHVVIIKRDGGWNTAPVPIAETQFYPGTLQATGSPPQSAEEPEPNCCKGAGFHLVLSTWGCGETDRGGERESTHEHLCAFVGGVLWYVHEGQSTTCRNQFASSTLWVLGIKLRSSGWLYPLSHPTSTFLCHFKSLSPSLPFLIPTHLPTCSVISAKHSSTLTREVLLGPLYHQLPWAH